MYAYILRRLLAVIPVMGVVAVFVFLLLHLTPGDPAAVIAGNYAMPEDVARIREKLGLDEPIHVQFVTWLGQILSGDLGVSIHSNLPVTRLIGQRLEPTVSLALASMLIAVTIALPLGVLAAWRAGSWVDHAVMVFAVLGFSVPVFVVGYLLIYGFSIQLQWFPVQGFTPLSEGVVPFLRSIALPSLALGLIYAALIARITRASVLRVLSEDYILTAHAKGASSRVVLTRHALKNAAVPIVTVIGIGISAAHRRRGGHRERVQHHRAGAAGGRLGAAPGLPRDPGGHPDVRRGLRAHQSGRGHRVHVSGPEDSLLNRGTANPCGTELWQRPPARDGRARRSPRAHRR